MACDRGIFISAIVLICVSASITFASVIDVQQNLSAASIRFDGALRDLPKVPINWQPRSLEVLKTYNTCSGLEVLNDQLQPIYSPQTSFIRKCCPLGQSYVYDETEHGRKCAPVQQSNLNITILNATFYENCIEDNESGPQLDYRIIDACGQSIVNVSQKISSSNQLILYSKSYGDLLYVLQNGSLLIVEENFEGYEVNDDYCLDVNRNDGFVYAIVCVRKSTYHTRVLRAEAYLYSSCLLISVPCLLLTAFFYVKIDELRDLHGKSLACHCVCLAIAYAFLSIVQIQQNVSYLLTYFIQYFLLSCICWLNVLCFDICMKISYTYLKGCSCVENTEDKYFTAYAITSFTLPILPVMIATMRHMFGIPLYYIKGQHNIDSNAEYFFILPAGILLLFCSCFLLVTLYIFGRRRPKPPKEGQGSLAVSEYEEFYKLKQTAQSIAFLFVTMSICMIIEMITSNINEATTPADATTMSPFAFFDVLIALQGVFIFMIFICSPKPLKIICRWWVESGSLDVAAFTELEALQKNKSNILD